MIGKKMQRIRVSKGWSFKELGEKSGVSPVQLGRYERNINMPRPETVSKIADALEIDPEELTEPKSTVARTIDREKLTTKFFRLLGSTETGADDLALLDYIIDLLLVNGRSDELLSEFLSREKKV